ncbi:MAG: DedA family protein [bacterium]|nr:MAG: hypothetical protein DIU52_08215 [bacterium]
MDSLLPAIIEHLIKIGPWVVFAVALAETAVFIGLLIPAEATVLIGAFMADQGYFEVEHIFAGAFAGGLIGDQTGYLLGRYSGGRFVGRGGRFGQVWSHYEVLTAKLFRRRAAMAVTVARFLSFVRTLMPWCAGMSRMPYLRFLAYDMLGVLGWAGGSVALGYLAGESWKLIAGALGTAGGLVLALIVVAVAMVAVRRRLKSEPSVG